MGRFAKGTSVSCQKSRFEIENLVTKYGASAFVSAVQGQMAVLEFQFHTRRIRFKLNLPLPQDFATAGTQRKRKLTSSQATARCEQEARRMWRALLLAIKAKLECVASGISTFETEFLAHIVIPGNRQTFGEWAAPQIEGAYSGKELPPLLGCTP